MKKELNKEDVEKANNLLVSLLVKLGMGSKWAGIVASAIIAAAIAYFGLTLTGCSSGGYSITGPLGYTITFHPNSIQDGK